MKRTVLLALALFSLLALPTPVFASDADEAIQPLKQAFDNLYLSLKNQGGMSDQDRPTLERLRQRFNAFNDANPDNKPGISYELQLAIWLGDDDRADTLFSRLFDLSPDDSQIGLAWADYFISKDDYTRADRAFARILEAFPDDPSLRIEYAQRLKDRNLYGRALEIMQRTDWDYAKWPDAAALLSDCYFAQQQFDDAVAVLEAIPAAEDLPADKRPIKAKADTSLEEMRQYREYWSEEQAVRAAEAEADDLPRAQIVTTRGVIVLELFENEAPNTVANFISLAESKFYAGTTFHRVVPNFMAQGGDPNSKPGATGVLGQGNPGYYIADEVDHEGARRHFTGSLAMAKSPLPNSAGCQFYITVTPTPWLNGKHTVFGRVVEGLSVVRQLQPGDRIEAVMITRKRDHTYAPEKLPLASGAQPIQIGESVEGVISNEAKLNEQIPGKSGTTTPPPSSPPATTPPPAQAPPPSGGSGNPGGN